MRRSSTVRSRRGWPIAVLGIALGLTACASRSEPGATPPRAESELERRPEGRIELDLTAASVQAGDLALGSLREPWDRASRVEAELWYHIGLPGRLDPMVGAYGFYEARKWSEGAGEVDARAAGLGVQLGARFDPSNAFEERSVHLTLTPYSRLGAALQDGEFENVPASGGFSSGDIDRWQVEGTVGADVRLEWMKTLVLGVGAGLTGWISPELEGVTRVPGGPVVDFEDRLPFWGWEVFVRFTAGIDF